MLERLIAAYGLRLSNKRITESESILFIDLYISAIKLVPEAEIAPESLMLLKCLIKAGDDLPLLPYYRSPAEFHKAFRVGEIIYNRGLASFDTIVWHLLHEDKVMDSVYRSYFKEFYRKLDEENKNDPK